MPPTMGKGSRRLSFTSQPHWMLQYGEPSWPSAQDVGGFTSWTTGPIEDDPNLTNRRFPGNPTKSYRSRSAFRVIGEITDWKGHSSDKLKEMHDHLENLKQRGVEAIEE